MGSTSAVYISKTLLTLELASIVNPTMVDGVLGNISAVLFDVTIYTEITQFCCIICLVVYGSMTCKSVNKVLFGLLLASYYFEKPLYYLRQI